MKGFVGKMGLIFGVFFLFLNNSLKEILHRNVDIVCYNVLPVRRQETQAARPIDRLLPWVL